jgi:hypothetical protein
MDRQTRIQLAAQLRSGFRDPEFVVPLQSLSREVERAPADGSSSPPAGAAAEREEDG